MKLRQKKFARHMFLSLYGINTCTANKIIGLLRLHPQAGGSNLFRKRYSSLYPLILDSLRIEFRLRLIVFSRICLQLFCGTYRGIRRYQGLPSRGQRTHANGKTPRRLKSVGSNFPFNFKAATAKALAIKRVMMAKKNVKNKSTQKTMAKSQKQPTKKGKTKINKKKGNSK